jgi:hypothetical protein
VLVFEDGDAGQDGGVSFVVLGEDGADGLS